MTTDPKALVAELRNVRLGLADEAAACIEQLQRERDYQDADIGMVHEALDKAESALAAATAEREGLKVMIQTFLDAYDMEPSFDRQMECAFAVLEFRAALTKAKGAT